MAKVGIGEMTQDVAMRFVSDAVGANPSLLFVDDIDQLWGAARVRPLRSGEFRCNDCLGIFPFIRAFLFRPPDRGLNPLLVPTVQPLCAGCYEARVKKANTRRHHNQPTQVKCGHFTIHVH